MKKLPLLVLSLSSFAGIALVSNVKPASAIVFTQCPAVGNATGCNLLITANANGSFSTAVASNPTQPPYDGSDDQLVGVQNNSILALTSLTLTGSGIFAFEVGPSGDGICSTSYLNCNFGPTRYEGPNTSFTVVNNNSGTVNFLNGGIQPSLSAYFSLENIATINTTVTGGTTTNPGTAVPEPFTVIGTTIGGAIAFRMRKRLKVTNKL